MSEIDALLNEHRSFEPSPEWRRSATIADPTVYDRAAADLEGFWAGFASELEWMRPWDSVLEWQSPHAK
jgi:acetyl-CoA synthetase